MSHRAAVFLLCGLTVLGIPRESVAEVCGDGMVMGTEECDGNSCAGGPCRADCTCPCPNVAIDTVAHVVVATRNGAGRLNVKMRFFAIPYTGEPVTVRLDDTDTQPIVQQLVPTLPERAFGKWEFRSEGDGLKKITLKAHREEPGLFQLRVKATRWFAFAGGADQPAAATDFTVTIGTQCFTHPATKKID